VGLGFSFFPESGPSGSEKFCGVVFRFFLRVPEAGADGVGGPGF